MNPIELIVRRRLVDAFIKADSVRVSFIRRVNRQKTEAGGWVSEPDLPPLSPQTVRLIPSKRRFDNGLINAEAGEIPKSEYLLLGSYRLDVRVTDIFLLDGLWYRVTGIIPNTTERTLCSVDLRGPTNE